MVEFKIREYHGRLADNISIVPIIDGKMVKMGESHSSIRKAICQIHGEQIHIEGENQGGFDCMGVCLKCCAEILQHVEKNGLTANETINHVEFYKKYEEQK